MADLQFLPYVGDFVALDFETTGTDVETDTIIEIGAIKYQQGKAVDRFHTLVNPFMPIPRFITQLTGLTDEDFASAPPFAHIIEPFWKFLDGFPIMAHNALFELRFLQKFFGPDFQPPMLDTVQLFQIVHPNHFSHSLEQYAALSGIPLPKGQTHRAIDDVELMVKAVNHSIGQLLQPSYRPVIATINALVQRLKPCFWAWAELFRNLQQNPASESDSLTLLLSANQRTEVEAEGRKERMPLDPYLFYLPVLVQDESLRSILQQLVSAPIHYVELSRWARQLPELLRRRQNQERTFITVATEPSPEWLLGSLIGSLAYVQEHQHPVCIVAPSSQKRDDLRQMTQAIIDAVQVPEVRLVTVYRPRHFLCPRHLTRLIENYDSRYDTPVGTEFFARLFLILWHQKTREGNISEIPYQLRKSDVFRYWLDQLTQHDVACQRDPNCYYFYYYQLAQSAHLLFADYSTLIEELPEQDPAMDVLTQLRPPIVGYEGETFDELRLNQQTVRIPLRHCKQVFKVVESSISAAQAVIQRLQYSLQELLDELHQSSKEVAITYVPLQDNESSWSDALKTVKQELDTLLSRYSEELTAIPVYHWSLREMAQSLQTFIQRFTDATYTPYAQLYRRGESLLVMAPIIDQGPTLAQYCTYAPVMVIGSSLFYHTAEQHRLAQLLFGDQPVERIELSVRTATYGKVIFAKSLPSASSDYFGEKVALFLHRLLPSLKERVLVVAHQRAILDQIYRLVAESLGDRLVYYGKTLRTLTALKEQFGLSKRSDKSSQILLSVPLDFHALGYQFGDFQWIIYDRLPYPVPTPREESQQQQWLRQHQKGDESRREAWAAVGQPLMFRAFRKLFDFLSYGAQSPYMLMVLDPNLTSTTLAPYHYQLLEYLPGIKPVLEHYDAVIKQLERPLPSLQD